MLLIYLSKYVGPREVASCAPHSNLILSEAEARRIPAENWAYASENAWRALFAATLATVAGAKPLPTSSVIRCVERFFAFLLESQFSVQLAVHVAVQCWGKLGKRHWKQQDPFLSRCTGNRLTAQYRSHCVSHIQFVGVRLHDSGPLSSSSL